jgi:hypothetical protein
MIKWPYLNNLLFKKYWLLVIIYVLRVLQLKNIEKKIFDVLLKIRVKWGKSQLKEPPK